MITYITLYYLAFYLFSLIFFYFVIYFNWFNLLICAFIFTITKPKFASKIPADIKLSKKDKKE